MDNRAIVGSLKYWKNVLRMLVMIVYTCKVDGLPWGIVVVYGILEYSWVIGRRLSGNLRQSRKNKTTVPDGSYTRVRHY